MATLSQALRSTPQQDQTQLTKGNGGQLQEQSLSGAMQNIGLQTAPTTPLGAQMIGANPDVAKMAGTPAQLNAANNKQQAQQAPQESLQTALRQQQARTQLTGQEQNTVQKSADMQALGGLGDRVTGFIQSEMNKLTAQTQPVAVAAQDKFQNKDISSYKSDIEALRANPSDMNLMLKVQQELGMDVNSPLSTDQINQLYQTASQAIGAGAAGTIADTLQVSNLIQDPQFGYDAATLSNLLGVPEAELSNYTVDQLTNKINQVQADEFSKSQQQQQQASSIYTGQAERDLARQQGRDISATGIRATEDDFNKLTQSIQNADQIGFGGKTYAVEDLLKDDTISEIVKTYLESPEGSDIRNDLDTTEPELSNFIKNNQAALAEASANLEAGATEFRAIQDDNKKLQTESFGGIPLDSNIMKNIIPGWSSLASSRIDPSQVPVLDYLKDKPQQNKQQFANEINSLHATNPSTAKELANLHPQELDSLGIDRNGPRWKTYKNIMQDFKDVVNTDPSDTASLLAHYSPSIMSVDQVNNDIQTNYKLAQLGFGDKNYSPGNLPIKNGQVDIENLKNTYLNQNPYPNLSQAAAGKFNSARFNYSPVKAPAPGSLQGKIVRDFSDLVEGPEGKPSVDQMKNRLTQLLNTTRSIKQGTGDNGTISPADQWIAKSEIINDLRNAGTWRLWGFTEEDQDKMNPSPFNNVEMNNAPINVPDINVGYVGS